MAIRSLNILKAWFETGDKPTQAQFWDWLDSFFHKEETIPIASIDGLTAALNDKAEASAVDDLTPTVITGSTATHVVNHNGGKILHKIRIKSTSAMGSFKIGTTSGGNEIMAAESISADTPTIFTLDFDLESAGDIHFSGLAGSWSIKIVFQ